MDTLLRESSVLTQQQVITGLEEGQNIEVTTKDGMIRGVVSKLSDILIVVVLLEPLTSKRAHSYHWDAGNLKSILFRDILSLKRISYDDSPKPKIFN